MTDQQYFRDKLRLLDQKGFQGDVLCVLPAMTVSRQCEAGMNRIARKLIEYLDEVDDHDLPSWIYCNQSMIGTLIENGRFKSTPIPFNGKSSKFPHGSKVQEVLSQPRESWTLFHHNSTLIRSLCSNGKVIIEGRAANMVTSDFSNVFCVRLIGAEKKRIERASDRHRITKEKAAEFVRKSDEAKAKYVARYTGSDIESPGNYHLVINTDDYSDDLLVRVLGDTLLEWASTISG